jgi:hypothetical protein
MSAEHTQNTLSAHADIHTHKCTRDACAMFLLQSGSGGAFFKCLLHAYLTHVAMPTKILSVRVRTLLCVCASTPIYVCVYKSPHLLYMAPPPLLAARSALSLRTAYMHTYCAAEPRMAGCSAVYLYLYVSARARAAMIATSFIALLFQSSKSHPAKGLSPAEC